MKRKNHVSSAATSLPLITLQRILVPVDFARPALKALSYARAMAVTLGAKIDLLHVTKPIAFCTDCGYGPVNRQIQDETRMRQDRSRLKRWAVRQVPAEALGEIIVRSGNIATQILDAAAAARSGLIILYAHEPAEAATLGSQTVIERVARAACCPVLVIRSAEQDFVRSRMRPRKTSRHGVR